MLIQPGIAVRMVAPLAAVVAARAAYQLGARELGVPRYRLEERLTPESAAGERWIAVQAHALVVVAGTAEPLTMDEFGFRFDDDVLDRLTRDALERIEQSVDTSQVPEYRPFSVVAPPEPEWVPVARGRPSRRRMRPWR